ncbi:MAG: HDOD domain-containing protein [Bdellovibrionota bacterium]
MTLNTSTSSAPPAAPQPVLNPALQECVKQLCEVELPAVASTVSKIQELSQNESCALQALADVILQDAAMTTHVLRLTSSAYHVRGSRSNSVTRALVMLGFNEVRAICISVAVMDDLIRKGKHKPFVTELGRAFHSAVQAEQLACAIGDRSSQEVFIAALLYDLGKMLFYCFGGEKAELLVNALEGNKSRPEAEIEQEVLGFQLAELTQALAKKWGLGELLVKAVSSTEKANNRIAGVRLGRSFAHAVEKGWDSPEAEKLIGSMSELTGMSPVVLTPMLYSAAEKARGIAEEFRASAAAKAIPEAPDLTSTPLERPKQEEPAVERFAPKPPDPAYQLLALRNISLKLESRPEVHELVDLVLEGIFRGMGMDRAMFAMLSPNRKYLSGKSALGYQNNELLAHFKFPVDPEDPNIFQWVIEGQQAVWVQDQEQAEFRRQISPAIRQAIGSSPFFIAPTIVTGKPIGLFFADRCASNRPLDVELFQTFKQFVMTANISLEHLKLLHASNGGKPPGAS